MDWKTLLFSFDGRINRAKYWLVLLLSSLAVLVAAFVGSILVSALGAIAGYLIAGVIAAALIIPAVVGNLATAVKRLHDRQKSGWWLLLFYVAPNLLDMANASPSESGNLMLTIVGIGIGVWGFIELGCLKGTTGDNAYGPDPLPPEPT